MYWSRLRVFLILVLLVMVVLGVRLAHMQLARAEVYSRAADSNLIRPTVLLETRRGTIRDRNGLPLAEDVPHYDLCIYFPFLALPDEAFIERKARREARSLEDIRTEMDRFWVEARQLRKLKTQIGRKDESDAKLLQEMSDFWPALAERADLSLDTLDQRREEFLRTVTTGGDLVRRQQQRDDIRIREETYGVPGSVPHAIISEGLNARTKAYIASLQAERPFLVIRERSERRYNYGNLAGLVLGHIGKANENEVDKLPGGTDPVTAAEELRAYRLDDECGRGGLEAAMENVLRGSLGLERRRRDGLILESVPPKAGQDVVLTLDVPFQSEVEGLMDHAENLPPDYGRPRGAAVVIDLASGGIRALVSTPRYDPNSYQADFDDFRLDGSGEPYLHRAVAGQYALGSCFKIVTGTAALHEGVVTAGTLLHCAHYLDPRYSERFTCLGWHGDLAIVQAYCKSCNLYFYQAGQMLGRDRLVAWGRHWGFGKPIGLVGVAEAAGNLPYRIDVRNLAIGQGELTVTPLQVARMVALAATGGRMTEVHLVQSPLPAERPLRQVGLDLRPELMALVRRGLRDVVNDPAGTGYNSARSEEILIAGKTGSPEIGRNQLTHSWFIGYAPADRPQIAFAVVFEKAGHGPTVAAPVARKIVETALRQKLITAN